MAVIYSKLLPILIILTTFWLPTPKHPLHVSTTEIEFNAKEKSLEISCRIFTDDFENILAKQYKAKTDLNNPAMHQAMDLLIKKYLATNLKYKVNGKNLVATYIGFEKDNEATNVYLEIDNIAFLQNLSLTNSVLYDLFDDQMNILHVVKSGNRKSARVNYPARALNIAF